MDVNGIVRELHAEIGKAKRMNISLDSNVRGLANFDRAKAQHVLERIRSLRARLEERTSMALPSDLDALDIAAMELSSDPQQSSAMSVMPRFPHTIQGEMRADFEEMNKCLEAGCFRSAIILCARMLETALHCKYFETTGNDLLEKAPGTGLGSLVAKLAERGVSIDPGLANQIHLINQVRVHSVHKKQEVFAPSEEQARAIVMYTVDVMRKLFS